MQVSLPVRIMENRKINVKTITTHERTELQLAALL